MTDKSASGFSAITGQQQPVGILISLLRSRNIPHALLFTGIAGIGREAAAVEFAKACNCDSAGPATESAVVGACGHCRSCRTIAAGHHPDVLRISPEKSIIRIARIRELAGTLTLKPLSARWRVIVVNDAHTMNPPAANALLKILEEPPPNTILILLAHQTADLLPTIVSRCQHIRFHPIPAPSIVSHLTSENGIDPDRAAVAAALSGGSLTLARNRSEPGWFNRRRWLLEQLTELPDAEPVRVLALAEELARNREALPEVLEWMTCWLRDVLVSPHAPEKIINKDLTDSIQYVSQRIAVETVLSKVQAVQTAGRHIKGNANARLTLEGLLLELAA